ncbi:MAG: AMP-binding protein [Candidatus Tectomicrobia bacterium]|uniref:AMP-binding protein n=1 Tax=Tectimicrobiota bacterium TaxID=2528274 RepID=A0A932M183_UNCTE|nr:AMP-binding protein [Candidatus Tectomicrobia bacterium]
MKQSIFSEVSLQSKYWNPYTETMPREEINALHLKRIQKLLRYAYDRVPLYRKLYDRAGLKPEDICTLEDFDRLVPSIDKKDLLEAQAKRPPWGEAAALGEETLLYRYQTSGSTGVPLGIPVSYYDSIRYGDQWAYGFWGLGLRPGHTFYFAFGWGAFIGFWSAYWGVRRIGGTVFSGGGLSTEMRLKQLLEYKPTVFLSTPTYALYMVEKAREMGIHLRDIGIKVMYLSGEPGVSIPSTRKAIEDAWGAKAYEQYGIGEVGAICPTCPHQLGVHLAEDFAYSTVVNPETGQAVSEGEAGENLVTSYAQLYQPVIKYRTHDLVRPSYSVCECGRTWTLFRDGVRGRTDHMVIIKGSNLYPTAVEALLGTIAGLSPHYEIHISRGPLNDEVSVKVEAAQDAPASGYLELQKKAEETLYSRILVKIGVEICAPGALPRYELKAKRFFDHRPKS